MKLYRKINVTEGHKRKDGDARVRGPIYKTNKTSTKKLFLTTQKMFFCSLYFLNILLYKFSCRDEQIYSLRREQHHFVDVINLVWTTYLAG